MYHFFFEHDWKNMAVRTGSKSSMIEENTPVTVVLQVCNGCYKIRTQTVVGNWKLEDINGNQK